MKLYHLSTLSADLDQTYEHILLVGIDWRFVQTRRPGMLAKVSLLDFFVSTSSFECGKSPWTEIESRLHKTINTKKHLLSALHNIYFPINVYIKRSLPLAMIAYPPVKDYEIGLFQLLSTFLYSHTRIHQARIQRLLSKPAKVNKRSRYPYATKDK